MLGRAVHAQDLRGHHASLGRHVDDVADARLHHPRSERRHAVSHPQHVDADRPLPLGRRGGQHGSGRPNTSVVAQDVHVAVPLPALLGHPGNGIGIGYVAHHAEDVAAVGRQPGHLGVQPGTV